MMKDRFMTGKQLAELLHVSVRTLEGWRLKGGGPPFARFGKVVVYDKIDVDLWINERIYQNREHRISQKALAHGNK